jgi:hypothetical protein
MGDLYECIMHTRLPYRVGDGARRGVPGPGGTSSTASTTTRRITIDSRSEFSMGIFSFAYTKIATHERSERTEEVEGSPPEGS